MNVCMVGGWMDTCTCRWMDRWMDVTKDDKVKADALMEKKDEWMKTKRIHINELDKKTVQITYDHTST